MLPVIHIGPAAMQSLSLALIVALWLGTLIAERDAKSRGLNANDVWNISALWIVTTIIGARFAFVAQYFSAYANDVAQIFAPTPNALSMEYGAILGLVTAYAYLWWRKISVAHFADAVTRGVLIAIAIIAFGQFLSGDAYGTPTNVPWAIQLWDQPRHPVQGYDALFAIGGIAIVSVMARRALRPGFVALFGLVWYSAARVFIEAFREDVALLGNGYRLIQVIALLILLVALTLIARTNNSPGGNYG